MKIQLPQVKIIIPEIKYADKRRMEFITSLYCILWGMWLLLPFDTFGSSAVFSHFAKAAPEWAWGMGVLMSGLIQAFLAFQNSIKMSLVAAGICMFTFFTLLIFSIYGNFMATSTVTYFVLTFVSVYSYFELLAILKKKI